MDSQSQAVAKAAAANALANMQQQGAMVAAATSAITDQQMFIINAFRGQIYISDTLDVQDTPVYDTLTYTAGGTIQQSNNQFFANVEQGSGKTQAQTNMTQNNKLDAPEAISVFGIRLGWSEDSLRSDLQTLVNSWAYQFSLGKKYYSLANIRHYSAGWGITGFTTRTSESAYTNGFPSRGSMNLLEIKLVIANQMSFYAQLVGNTSQVLSASGTGMILLNELVGLYARGVQ
jgi:hypothetical protein